MVIVTGAGRSGTSAVARVLHESGIRMGGDFDEPTTFNSTGYYQERSVYLVNESMLAEMGMAGLEGSARWPWRSTVLAIAEGYQGQMAAVASSDTDGWKDPIFSVTLEAWLPHLATRPKLVVCLRSPEAYADSVTHIFGVVRREAVMRSWARHYERLLDVIRDYRLEATCVEYDVLLQRPQEAVAALAEFVGHPLDASYVRPELRRFVGPMPAKYAALYSRVRQLARGSASAGSEEPVTQGSATTGAALRPGRVRAPGRGRKAADEYLRAVTEIDIMARTAKAAWTTRLRLPALRLKQLQDSNLPVGDALDETRDASREYTSVLREAQVRLSAMAVPEGMDRYHELALQEVNAERLVAELMLAAVLDQAPVERPLETALRAWRRLARGEAVDELRTRRQRECLNALKIMSAQGGD